MPVDKYRGVSLHKDLVGTIEEYIKTHPEMGYKSLSDFITDAIREKCEQLGIFLPKPEFPVLEHFNLNDTGVRILDRSPCHQVKSSGKVIDIHFRPEGDPGQPTASQTVAVTSTFALTVRAIGEVVEKKRKEGWKLPESA